MLFVCDVLEHLEEMIGQSAINRRSRSSAASRSLRGRQEGAAAGGRAGGLFFFREWSSAGGKSRLGKDHNPTSVKT